MLAPMCWMPNCSPTPLPARSLGRGFHGPRLQHRAHGVEEEADQRDEQHERHALPGERHEHDHHARQDHARHDDALAAHPVGQVPADRARREARDLHRRHADADDERRIVELVGEIDREEGEQPGLRHGAEGRADRDQHQRAVAEQAREVLQIVPHAARLAAGVDVIVRRAHRERAQHDEDQRRHHQSRHDVDDHDGAPAEPGEQRADHERGERRRRRCRPCRGTTITSPLRSG